MTLFTILALVGLASDRKDDEVDRHIDGMPWSLDRTGRIKVGNGGKEGDPYLRVIKYPWFNFYQALQSAGYALRTGSLYDPSTILQEFLSEGPLWVAMNIAMDNVNRHDYWKSRSARLAEVAAPFIPYSRVSAGVRMMQGGELRHPTNFTEGIARYLPFPSEWVGISHGGQARVDKSTGKIVILDPTVEQIKFWTGINIKFISGKNYYEYKWKLLNNALKALDKAETPDEAQKAVTRLGEIDPLRYGDAAKLVGKNGITIAEKIAKEIVRGDKIRRREAREAREGSETPEE
jgi:hypothetical protein